MKDPAVNTVVAFAGGNTTHEQGRMFITLKPLERAESQRRSGDRTAAAQS